MKYCKEFRGAEVSRRSVEPGFVCFCGMRKVAAVLRENPVAVCVLRHVNPVRNLRFLISLDFSSTVETVSLNNLRSSLNDRLSKLLLD
jgi:hypothetical protein